MKLFLHFAQILSWDVENLFGATKYSQSVSIPFPAYVLQTILFSSIVYNKLFFESEFIIFVSLQAPHSFNPVKY